MLQNRVVVITGAGSGLGQALSKAFYEQGSVIIGIGRSEDKLQQTAALIGDSDRYVSCVADVSNSDQVSDVFRGIESDHGRIDYLFNNAAVYPKVNFLKESPEMWAHAIAINLNGVAYCCKAVLPGMIERKFGRIYNVGSWADLGPIADSAAYSCSKGGLHALTKAVAVDLKQTDADIEVHEWIPGHLNTQMSDYTGIDPSISAAWAVDIANIPHASSRSCIYEQNREWQRPEGIKRRIMKRIQFWK